MKVVVSVIVLILVGLGAFMYFSPAEDEAAVMEEEGTEEVMEESTDKPAQEGAYRVVADESVVNWSGKKPLVDGYINTGVLNVTGGSLVVSGAESSGSFEIDMNTLSVSETKAKPGAESALEDHLKGEGWFNVEEYPTANFETSSVTPREGSEAEFLFDIVGNLTMKGETGEIEFPARIYQNSAGQLIAEAEFEIDRTLWGITAGSGSFFDDLADNVVDDMIALSFVLVAEPGEAVDDEGAMEDEAMMEDSENMEEGEGDEMEAMEEEDPVVE